MADYNFVNVDLVMKLEPMDDMDNETNMIQEPVDPFVAYGCHDVKKEIIKRESPQTDDGDDNSYISQMVSDDEDVMNIRRPANIATTTGRGRGQKRGRGRRRGRERPGVARVENELGNPSTSYGAGLDYGTEEYEEIEAGSSNRGRTRDSLTRDGGVGTRDGGVRSRGGSERARGGSERARGGSERVRGGSERARGGSERVRGGSERARGGSERVRGGSERARGANVLARGASAGSRSKPQGVRRRGNTDSESIIKEGFGILQDDPLEMPKPRRFLAPRGTATTEPMLPGPSFTLPSPRTVANPIKKFSTPSTSHDHTMLQGTDGATPRKVSRNQRPLQDTDEDFHRAYGSENDSEDDEDAYIENSIIPMFVPRTQRDIFPFDDEDESPTQEIAASPSSSDKSTALPILEPRNLFSFEWRDFPNPPVPLTERREVFSDTNCGPTAPFLTPYDAFIAIWNREIMEYIVLETNRYAQQIANKQYQEGSLGPHSRISQWQETYVDELYIYFALLLGTSMCYKSDIKEYWYKEGLLATPYFGYYMTYNRFLLLSTCLHFNNNTTDLQTMTRPQAKIFKIAPIVQHLNHQFQSLYNLNRNITLDESLTQCLLNIKQFMKNKAASCGIKTYEVCESQTGYLWRFKVLAGREEATESKVTPVSGAIASLVLDLLKGLENKGHTVWMDNYYNSPALARVLKSLGFDCVGPLRTNRQLVPPQLANLRKCDMAVGQIAGCTSGDVDIMVWRDKSRVGFISTYHGAGVHTDDQGNVKPIVVRDYNLCMGGVDKKDQMMSMYPLERKRAQVWYKTFFRRLLNASILNAYILHSHSSHDSETRFSNHRKFRQNLLKDLLRRHSEITIPTHSVASSKSTSLLTPQVLLEHLPKEYGLVPGTTRNERLRRVCLVCRKRIQYHCPTCMVPLCPTSCHSSYHKRNFNRIWF